MVCLNHGQLSFLVASSEPTDQQQDQEDDRQNHLQADRTRCVTDTTENKGCRVQQGEYKRARTKFRFHLTVLSTAPRRWKVRTRKDTRGRILLGSVVIDGEAAQTLLCEIAAATVTTALTRDRATHGCRQLVER